MSANQNFDFTEVADGGQVEGEKREYQAERTHDEERKRTIRRTCSLKSE